MRAIDYMSIFFMLGAAPTWQPALDHLSPGLGSSLVLIILVTAIRTVLHETETPKKHIIAKNKLRYCRGCASPCRG